MFKWTFRTVLFYRRSRSTQFAAIGCIIPRKSKRKERGEASNSRLKGSSDRKLPKGAAEAPSQGPFTPPSSLFHLHSSNACPTTSLTLPKVWLLTDSQPYCNRLCLNFTGSLEVHSTSVDPLCREIQGAMRSNRMSARSINNPVASKQSVIRDRRQVS